MNLRQIDRGAGCILQPVAFCNWCPTTKKAAQIVGAIRTAKGVKVFPSIHTSSLTKYGGLFNDDVSFSVYRAVPAVVPAGRCSVLEKWFTVRGGHSYARQKA